ncbi:hypothetical protein NAC44_15770 [Allorhizobium sp. BGMRC 0089]|uniref:hypothetical protein n=1 Tax=Allorhizobium sonneratiae TaxID=2934936 RepID=UPI00203413CB|nr:hypothetical protein [Allorhizobium sonneratiae]MCM2293785.1 hypothetical protein [Allorhizobium sonneratiae]
MISLFDKLYIVAGLAAGLLAYGAYDWLIGYPHEKAVIEAAMVSKAEAEALQARLARETQLREAAEQAENEAEAREAATEAARAATEAKITDLQRQAASQPGLSHWTAEELQWLQEH